jgi:hypothetical protein
VKAIWFAMLLVLSAMCSAAHAADQHWIDNMRSGCDNAARYPGYTCEGRFYADERDVQRAVDCNYTNGIVSGLTVDGRICAPVNSSAVDQAIKFVPRCAPRALEDYASKIVWDVLTATWPCPR